MSKLYKLVFVYPDGHIEEVENLFNNGKDALEYGNNLLGQVVNTEGVFHPSGENEFGFKKKIDPYFMIIEINGKKYHLVYDSRMDH